MDHRSHRRHPELHPSRADLGGADRPRGSGGGDRGRRLQSGQQRAALGAQGRRRLVQWRAPPRVPVRRDEGRLPAALRSPSPARGRLLGPLRAPARRGRPLARLRRLLRLRPGRVRQGRDLPGDGSQALGCRAGEDPGRGGGGPAHRLLRDAHDLRVYGAARRALDRLVADGALCRDGRALYLYREVMAGRAQTGVVGGVHVDDYEADVIRKHETTRPDKEDDRTRHLLALEAHAEPVLLLYRGRPEMDRLVVAATAAPPLYDFATADGVAHTLWRLADPVPYERAFEGVARAYVADGHHRSASAWRAAREP